jgi:hypothetical protein
MNIEELSEWSDEQISARMAFLANGYEQRALRADSEHRAYTAREQDLNEQTRQELTAIKAEVEQRDDDRRIKQEIEQRTGIIDGAIETRQRDSRLSPLMVSADNLAQLEEARRGFQSLTVIEERSMMQTSDLGTGELYQAGSLASPRNLWQASGIPTTVPDGYKGVVPQFALPAGVALVAEGTDHAEFDAVSPDSVTIGRAGAWSSLSSEAALSTRVSEIAAAHARIIARNLDKATVAVIEGSPTGGIGIDTALTTVSAEAAVDVSQLWIVGDPESVAALAGNATFAAASGSDVGSFAVRYGGAQLYVTPAAGTDLLTVFDPMSFRAFASPLASAVLLDPKDGSQSFGQWMFYGLGQSLVGSAVTVSLGGS